MKATIDISAIMKAADDAGPALDKHIGQALATASIAIADRARLVHDYIDRTQLLTNSIQAGPVSGSVFHGGLRVDIEAGGIGGVNYARYIEKGTKNMDGTVRIRARMFLENALEDQIDAARQRVEVAVGRAFEEVGL